MSNLMNLKKDLKIPGNKRSSGAFLYEAGQTKVGFVYHHVDPNRRTLNLTVTLYDEDTLPLNSPSGAALSIHEGVLQMGGESFRDEVTAFENLWPEIGTEGMKIVKRIPFNGVTLGDYI